MLESPVQVVELQLAEFHIFAIGVQEAFQHRQIAMAGKAQVPDAAVALLCHQIAVNMIFFIVQISVDIHFADIVEQVEIKVFHIQLFELGFKDFFYLPPV